MSELKLSVVLCAYNPNKAYLLRVLDSLNTQSLHKSSWELIIVDNNSKESIIGWLDLSWHPHARIIREANPGLIHARICGTENATTEFIISVDDDTILDPDYLAEAYRIFRDHPEMGIFGGRSVAEFESEPPVWISEYNTILCIKDLGENEIITRYNADEPAFPSNGPFLIAYRKEAFNFAFLTHFLSNDVSSTLGRTAGSLASGEDNDIAMSIYKSGYEVGYFPALKFTHIIPSFRIERDYIAKLIYASNLSWVRVLRLYGICPWAPIPSYSLGLRKAKNWFLMKAWASERNYINWKGSCGKLDALAES